MTWNYDSQYKCADRQAGLYLEKSNRGRDDFRFFVKSVIDDEIQLYFDAKGIGARELTDEEKVLHPGVYKVGIWQVGITNQDGVFNSLKIQLIKEALSAWSNSYRGHATFINGVGKRVISEFEFVDHVEGY